MEHVVLGLLIFQGMTLYEINQAFKQGISMFYSASYGSLQVAVKNLLGKGLIIFEEKVDKGRNKKVYTITEQGREAFFQWMRDEIPVSKLEVTGLSKVFFLGYIEDVEQKKQILREILKKIEMVEAELNSINEQIQQMQIAEPLREIAKYRWKTLDYGQKAHAFAREWFTALLEEL